MESGSARSVKEEAVGLPSLSVSGVVSHDKTFPLVWVFRPMDTRGTFENNIHMGRKPTPQTIGDPSMRGPVFGRAPYVVEPRKPRVKPNNVEDTAQKVNQDMVLPVLEVAQ